MTKGIPFKPNVVILLIFRVGKKCSELTPATVDSAVILKCLCNADFIVLVGAAHKISLLSPITSTKWFPFNLGSAQDTHIDFLWNSGSFI